MKKRTNIFTREQKVVLRGREKEIVFTGWGLKYKYHQHHSNGGGLVAETATVAETVYVGSDAIVCGYAKVSGNVKICDHATVTGHAKVSGNVKICDHARIYGNAKVSDYAHIFGSAKVYENAEVSGHAKISDVIRIYGNTIVTDEIELFGEGNVCGPDTKLTGKNNIREDRGICDCPDDLSIRERKEQRANVVHIEYVGIDI